jgi:hypothetical protein
VPGVDCVTTYLFSAMSVHKLHVLQLPIVCGKGEQ